jgi:cell division protein FtsL
MFGRSTRPVFKPSVYQPGKRSRRMPRWLVLLLVGIVIGAGGVLFLQANYGPQRLTIEQSEQLHSELSAANLDRQRLQGQLDEVTQERDVARSTHAKLTSDLGQAQQRITSLNNDLQLFEAAIPPDPRGGTIGVRSAILTRQQNQLAYQVLIMRDNEKGGATFRGTLQFAIEGNYRNGRVDTINSDAVPMQLDAYQNFSGNMTLPDNFNPRVVTVRVLDPNQRQQAMRVYYVKGAGAPASSSRSSGGRGGDGGSSAAAADGAAAQ